MPARGKGKAKANGQRSPAKEKKDERTCGQRMKEHEYLQAGSQVPVKVGGKTMQLQAGAFGYVVAFMCCMPT